YPPPDIPSSSVPCTKQRDLLWRDGFPERGRIPEISRSGPSCRKHHNRQEPPHRQGTSQTAASPHTLPPPPKTESAAFAHPIHEITPVCPGDPRSRLPPVAHSSKGTGADDLPRRF